MTTDPGRVSERQPCLNCNDTGFYRLDGALRPCLWDHATDDGDRCPICDHPGGHHDMYAHAAHQVANGAGGS